MPDEEKPEKPPRPPPSRWRRFLAAIFCCLTLKTSEAEDTEVFVPPGFYHTFTGEDLRDVRLVSWLNGFVKDEKLHVKDFVELARGVTLLRFVEGLFEVRIASPIDRPGFETSRGKRRRKLERSTVGAAVGYLLSVERLVLGGKMFENLVADVHRGNRRVIKELVLRLSEYYLTYLQRRSRCAPGEDPNVIHLPRVTCRVPALSPTAQRLERRLTKRDVLWDLRHKADVSNESLEVNVELIKNIRNEWRFAGIDESRWGIYKVGEATMPPQAWQGINLSRDGETCEDSGGSSCFDFSFGSVAEDDAVLEEGLSDVSFATIEEDRAALDDFRSRAPGLKKVTSYLNSHHPVDADEKAVDATAEQLVRTILADAVYDLEAERNAFA